MIKQRHTFLVPSGQKNILDQYHITKSFVKSTDWVSARNDRIIASPTVLSAKLLDELKSFEWLQISSLKTSSFSSESHAFAPYAIPGSQYSFQLADANVADISLFPVNQSIKTPNYDSFYNETAYSEEFLELVRSLIFALGGKSARVTEYAYQLANADYLSFSYKKDQEVILEAYFGESSLINSGQKRSSSIVMPRLGVADEPSMAELGVFKVQNLTSNIRGYILDGFIRSFDDDTYQQTYFEFSPSHRGLIDAYYDAHFEQPIGLHPKEVITLSSPATSPHDSKCRLFVKYNLPKQLFLDRYQLKDLERATDDQPAVGQLIGLWGEADLELPVWSVSGWGSESIIELYPGKSKYVLPMHSRYEIPNAEQKVLSEVPYPLVFWACHEEAPETSLEVKDLSYSSFFPKDTVFYHYKAGNSSMTTTLSIPVAFQGSYESVEWITSMVIVGGFVYLLTKIAMLFTTSSTATKKAKVE